ncbi:MAG TPA: GGDEF domain-containing protein, partial [Verrucomicrobiae bacterium]|nr:GGDEF domain-containing protein [Verrucomicrobiae bacterium]
NDLLQAIAKVFQNAIRECDLAGRFGGDEFIIILPETNLEEAHIVAQRIQERTETHLRQHFPGDVGMSLGVATYQGESLKDMLAKVDGLMYKVKRKQGNNSLSA